MTEPQQTTEKRQHFRKIYNEADAMGSAPQRDRYAKFMAEKFPDANKNYALEWAERFKHGQHWHKMDGNSMAAFLKVLTESYDGTRAEINHNSLRKPIQELTESRGAE